jgi:3-oxoacyl-[acyl-carrier protein] reductase
LTARLEGKVALITGAGGTAIGRASSLRFVAEGATVVCADREKDRAAGDELVEELTAAGGRAAAATVDLADHESVLSVLEDAIRQHGRLDVLFNLMVWGRVTRPDDWEWMLEATFAPTYFGTRYGCELMARHGGGSIINVSSVNGVALSPSVQPLPPITPETADEPITLGAGSYPAAKATVATLSKEYAVRYGRRNVRVNTIAPGFIATPFTLSFYAGEARERLEDAIPLGRLGAPEDIAGAAAFLASDDAAYVSGQVITVDGAYSQRPAW